MRNTINNNITSIITIMDKNTTAIRNIKNLESQNKKLRIKSTLNKILIPVAVVGGVFLGTQIHK